MSMRPKLPFSPIDLNLPGISYGEFALTAGDERLAPFDASCFTVAPGHRTPVDRHAVRECWLVVEGTGTLTYDERPVPIARGELLFFESDKPHFVENTGPGNLTIFSAWWPR
jgi:mannose-6-phosphate isomerase-like protein (cupin superfamily)